MKLRDLQREGVGYVKVQTPSGSAMVLTSEAVTFFKETLGVPVGVLVDLIDAHNAEHYDPETDTYEGFVTADLRDWQAEEGRARLKKGMCA